MPRIKTTRTVRVALWALRIYLLILLGLIALKFARVYSGHHRAAFGTTQSRVIHLPKDRSLGMLYTRDSSLVDVSAYADWKPLQEATGDVTVPAGKAVRLDVSKAASTDLSSLVALGPDDLDMLSCRGTDVDDDQLVHVKKMRSLKRLVLAETPVTEQGLAHLTENQDLEELEQPRPVTDAGLVYLSQLPLLKGVEIDGRLITADGLAALARMKSLEYVYVDRSDRMDAIVGQLTNNLPHLKRLTLGKGLTDEGIKQLKNLPSLEDLTVGAAQITGNGLAALAQVPSLKSLCLDNMELASEDEWVALGKITSLQRLTLRHILSEITDDYVSHLVGLQSLKDLSLQAIFLTDAKNAIASLSITDRGLAHLARLKSLETLELSGAKITDGGLQQLSKLPSLEWLGLQGCEVTEQGLEQLKKKLPALRWHL